MGTRIQKSRPTKRPQATVLLDGSPDWGDVRSGKPKRDKKGFPETNGIPYPVSVGIDSASTYPAPPAGVNALTGTWVYQSFAGSDDGHIADDGGGNLTVSDRNTEGTDFAATINNIFAGQTIWMGSYFGTWSAVVASVTDGAGFTVIAHEAPVVSDGFDFGQIVRFGAGTPT